MQSGSEDPEVANVLQKCEEYVPGKVCGDDLKFLMTLVLFDKLNCFPNEKMS